MSDAEKRPRGDHVEASIAALQRLAQRLRNGEPPEDVGPDVAILGRILGRRT